MTNVEIGRLDTPLGTLEVAAHEGALVSLKFDERWPGPSGPAAKPPRAGNRGGEDALARRFADANVVVADDPGGAVSALGAYFAGDIRAIDDLPVDVVGTPFQESVWKALRNVPAGETATYGEIARRIGAPRAVRAVGTSVGRNPVGIVIPCHRIVPSSGGIGNYGGGVDRKAWFLDHERRHR